MVSPPLTPLAADRAEHGITPLDRHLHLSSEDALPRKNRMQKRLGLLLILIPMMASAALVLSDSGAASPPAARAEEARDSASHACRARRRAVAGSAASLRRSHRHPDARLSFKVVRPWGRWLPNQGRLERLGRRCRLRRHSLVVRGKKGGTAGQPTPEHDSTPAAGARARPDFRHWRTICLRRQD